MSSVVRAARLQNRFVTACHVVFAWFCISANAHAFEQLTPAQMLVYDTAHLANTNAGQQIKYRYRSQSGAGDAISDRVMLSINKKHDDDRRDVVLDFLSDDRHMNLPDFSGYRGNPVIIAMLEHIAQGLGQETGGGVLYFRNRIRDGLSHADTKIDPITVQVGDAQVDANQLKFLPFIGDKYLSGKPEIANAAFSIVVSNAVPGGVITVAVKSIHNNATVFAKEIVIE